MKNYALKRTALSIPTILGAGILVFFLMRVIPGDICLARWVDYGTDLTPALLEYCRDDLGLNDPLYVQFFRFFWGILTLDLGVSMWTERPIIEDIQDRISLSFQLAIMALFATLIISIPLGTLAAIRQNSWIDYLIRFFSIIGIEIECLIKTG